MTIIGSSAVGKSSLHMRFSANRFQNSYCITYLAAQLMSTFEVEGDTVKYEVWDTAGQPRFRRSIPYYYKRAEATLIVYDITCRSSFEYAKSLLSQVKKDIHNMPTILVGNKLDLEAHREVPVEEASRCATKYDVMFIETSAKNNTNVTKLFETIYKINKCEKLARRSLRYRMNSFIRKRILLWCV